MAKSIILILLSTIFVLSSAYYFIVKTKREINLKDQKYLSEIAMENANVIEKIVNMNLDKIEAIANIIGSQEEFSIDYTLDILKMESTRSAYKRMGYVTLDGNAVTTDDEKFNVKTKEYFIKAVSGESNVSDRIEDKVGGELINVYAVPLYYQGKIQGIIFATSETNSFNKILSTPTFGGEGFSYIITKDGIPIVYSKNKNGLKEFSNLYNEIKIDNEEVLTMKRNMEQDRNGILEYSVDNVDRVGAYCKINVNDWYVLSAVPRYVISKDTDKFITMNTLIVFIITVIFLSLIAFIVVQNHKSRKRLEQVAYFDELISFPNYNAFKERAQKILKKNPHKEFVFIKLDVDNFKLINDRLGFEMGDEVLKNIARAIADIACEPEELFARIFVDEYIIMLNKKSDEELIELRHKLSHKFLEFMGPDFKYFVKFPTGLYITDRYENSIIEIFEKVNYAHRQAKILSEQGGIAEFYYDEAVKAKAVRDAEIENKMDTALRNKEFKCYLQPKYDLKTETIVGAEALVRWQDTEGNIISPREFISIFEHNGFITKLDMYMFKEVCRIIRSFIEKNDPIVTISVNFSRLHLLNPNFIDELVKISDDFRVPRKNIEIELTETVIFENEEVFTEVLHKLHDVGFTLSMDDFGTGYSSLGLLKNLPVDVIKIDRSFFTNNMCMTRAKSVIESIMLMARKLNIYTVAEGVESREHIDFLREVGCDIVQGYYYAKPMPVSEFKELMQSQATNLK